MEELREEIDADGADVERGRLPVVAIVGRPNAGKSTLFNRLVPGRLAIVDKTPGVTRDRNIGIAKVRGRRFLLIDTGGFEDADGSPLAESVRAQSALAAEEADIVLVLLDGSEGLNPDDRVLLDRLRRLGKPLIFAVNKVDTSKHEGRVADFYALGIDEMHTISAAHGIGIEELFRHVVDAFPALDTPEDDAEGETPVRLALIGRPNAGKSSLLNRIVGYERSIVDSTPGTTRDALDTPFELDGRKYVLVDTAGIRRRSRVVELVERVSVVRALSSLERAEVAALVIDAAQGMTDQDARIANYAFERRRALVLVFNKWDLLPDGENSSKKYFADVAYRYPSLADVPMVALSALKGSRVRALFPVLEEVVQHHRRQIGTADLNRVLAAAVEAHAPRAVRGRPPRFFYATQTGTAPPVITLFASAPHKVAPDYERYLYNCFRKAFDLRGTPLHIKLRKREH